MTTETDTKVAKPEITEWALRGPIGDNREAARESIRAAQLAIVRAGALADVRVEGRRFAQDKADALVKAAALLDQADAVLREMSSY